MEGPDTGQFRFSAATVAELTNSYEKVDAIPYRGELAAQGEERSFMDQYETPQISPGFYDYYVDTPGQLIPAATALWPLLKNLPDAANQRLVGQTLWQWPGLNLCCIAALLFFLLLAATRRWSKQNLAMPWNAWVMVLHPIMNAMVILWTANFIDSQINITGSVDHTVLIVAGFLTYVFAASAAFHVSAAISDSIVHYSGREAGDFDSSLLRVTARTVRFIAGAAILINGVRSLGLDLLPLIAGLVIGGLAVALAIRPTLENMIGGLILYADRPVQVGDFCGFGDNTSTVERIGLRFAGIIAESGTSIAFPSTTVYMGKDAGLDPDAIVAAERQVQD